MSRQGKLILGVFFMLVVASALFLARLNSAGQALGQPGLRLAAMELRNEDSQVVRTNGVALPAQVFDCTSSLSPVTKLELDWLPPDTTYGRRRYTFPDETWIESSVVLMGQDRTSIHKPEYCLPGQGFSIDLREVVTIPILQPHAYDLPVMKLTTSKTAHDRNGREVPLRGVYIYWFVADGKLATRHLDRMWMMTKGLLSEGELQRWAYVTYFAICQPGDEEATFDKMAGFIAESVPQFQTTTGKPKD
ncbi:MAG: exosortase-associated EpsI family protein [Verrucomicrobiota bacterium]|nr:exosortase-associated EpsI family protein [Verrucomicrobiota bacterium]MDP7441953.1 exosortase-associated EpsI family protein [Verrucomicrobiota bacterium]